MEESAGLGGKTPTISEEYRQSHPGCGQSLNVAHHLLFVIGQQNRVTFVKASLPRIRRHFLHLR